MFGWLHPLTVGLEFKDRLYRLGETVNLAVSVEARCDVEVREARVDLVCEACWMELRTVMVTDTAALAGGEFREPTLAGTSVKIPRAITSESRETYVLGSVVFLETARLGSGQATTIGSRLDLTPEMAELATRANLSWWLAVTVDVARARDVRLSRPVKVVMS